MSVPRLLRSLLVVSLSLAGASVLAQPWQVPQPTPGLMPNAATGRTLFARHCAACHGADLKGVDHGERRGPPLLHKIYEPSHHGDAAFQLAARQGVRAHHWPYGDMPPVPQVSADEVAHITAFVRAEQRKAGIH